MSRRRRMKHEPGTRRHLTFLARVSVLRRDWYNSHFPGQLREANRGARRPRKVMPTGGQAAGRAEREVHCHVLISVYSTLLEKRLYNVHVERE